MGGEAEVLPGGFSSGSFRCRGRSEGGMNDAVYNEPHAQPEPKSPRTHDGRAAASVLGDHRAEISNETVDRPRYRNLHRSAQKA